MQCSPTSNCWEVVIHAKKIAATIESPRTNSRRSIVVSQWVREKIVALRCSTKIWSSAYQCKYATGRSFEGLFAQSPCVCKGSKLEMMKQQQSKNSVEKRVSASKKDTDAPDKTQILEDGEPGRVLEGWRQLHPWSVAVDSYVFTNLPLSGPTHYLLCCFIPLPTSIHGPMRSSVTHTCGPQFSSSTCHFPWVVFMWYYTST